MIVRARVVAALLLAQIVLLLGAPGAAHAAGSLMPLFKRATPDDTAELSVADARSNTGTALPWVKTAFTSRFQALALHESGDWATSWLPRDWHPNTWVYRKSTSYLGSAGVQTQYPQYFVKLKNTSDFAAINYDCGGGGCTQPLLDVTSQAARDFWLRGSDNAVYDASNCVSRLGREADGVLDQLVCGYEGVWLDDVLADLQTSSNMSAPSNVANYRTGAGVSNTALNTALPFTPAAWSDGLATMLEQLKAAIVTLRSQGRIAAGRGAVAINYKWSSFGFAEASRTGANPTIESTSVAARFIRAADIVEQENGWIDGGLVYGSVGTSWSFARKRQFVQQVHALSRPVLQEKTNTRDIPNFNTIDCQKDHSLETWNDVIAHYSTANYNYAASLLDYVPGDWVGDLCEHVSLRYSTSRTGYATSGNWFNYGTGTTSNIRDNLGTPTSVPYLEASTGLLRRNFQFGWILVSPPGTPTKTVTYPTPVGVVAEHHGFSPFANATSLTISQREALILRTKPY